MQIITHKDIDGYSNASLKGLVVEHSQMLAVATKMISRLEKEVGKLSEALGAKHQQVLFTNESLKRMRLATFGRASERREGEERLEDIPNSLFSQTGGCVELEEESSVATKKKKSRKDFGRRSQPALTLQDVNHTINEEDQKTHGLTPWAGQFEESELITVIPSQIVLQRHRRQKYFRTDPVTGERSVITAPGPLKLKSGSRYSIEFGVEVGVSKYQWHLPLERQQKMLSLQGLDVTSQTLFDQIDTVAWYLKPTVFRGIRDEIHASYVNLADDTTWKNLGKREKEKKKKQDRFYLWAVTNPRAVCFNIYDSRSQETAKNFLGSLKGVLVSDGHSSFKALGSERLRLANDWYHVRRKFIYAENSFPEEARFFIDQIRHLSEIEREISGKPPDEIKLVRQTLSLPIVEAMGEYGASLEHILPQSSLGLALTYMRKLWSGLTVFLEDPLVPMDTNGVERILRGPAVGRKNHYGSKNLETAEVAAIWYSVVETCKMSGVDPRSYIVETLKAILSKKPYQMPWEWRTAREHPADILLQ